MVKKKTMGSLYFNDHPVAVGSKYDGQELSIGNTVPGEEITWVEVNGLLIADRCVCVSISAEQLDSLGFTAGKTITIDGQRYLCRLLKVGAEPDVPNEWDAALDATSEDDDLWHWEGMFFWGQESVEGWTASRAHRGYYSAHHWNGRSASHRGVSVGFRPALEPLDPDNLNSDHHSHKDGKTEFESKRRKSMKIVRDGKEIEITNKEAVVLAVGLSYERAEDTILAKLSMEFTSLPKGAIDEAVAKYQEVMFAAEKQAQEKALQAALETTRKIIVEDARMPGGYVCVTAYAALDEAALGEDDETPTCVLCVEENWLSNYIKTEWVSLEKFLSEYTYDAAEGMEQAAIGAGALAFVYCDRLDGGFRLCAEKDPAAQKAMLAFISDMLNDAGYEDASNWMDAQFRL